MEGNVNKMKKLNELIGTSLSGANKQTLVGARVLPRRHSSVQRSESQPLTVNSRTPKGTLKEAHAHEVVGDSLDKAAAELGTLMGAEGDEVSFWMAVCVMGSCMRASV